LLGVEQDAPRYSAARTVFRLTKDRTLVHLVVVAPEKMEERMEFVQRRRHGALVDGHGQSFL